MESPLLLRRRFDAPRAKALADAADACWAAILTQDLARFGAAVRAGFEAQVAMLDGAAGREAQRASASPLRGSFTSLSPHMVTPGILTAIDEYRDRCLGWKLSGAGPLPAWFPPWVRYLLLCRDAASGRSRGAHPFRGRRMSQPLPVPRERVAAFCRARGIRRLSLFGSVLRPDFGPHSDIDVLVEFEPGRTPGLFDMARLEHELSALFGERRVDLRTPEDLSRYFRQAVLEEAAVQYEAG